jgi:hypothetical protein
MPDFLTDLMAIEEQYRKILFSQLNILPDKTPNTLKNMDLVWMPLLGLICSKDKYSSRDKASTNVRVVCMACNLLLIDLAINLHCSIPDLNNSQDLVEEIQHPVLLGDLLYSIVYKKMSREGLEGYIKYVAELVSAIQNEHIKISIKKEKGEPYTTHLVNIYGLMSGYACYLSSRIINEGLYCIEKFYDLGYHIGILRGVWENNLDFYTYYNNWVQAWKIIDTLESGKTKIYMEQLLSYLGSKWDINKNTITKTIHA